MCVYLLIIVTQLLEAVQNLLRIALSFVKGFNSLVTGDLVTVLEFARRWRFEFAGSLDCHRAAIVERTTAAGDFDTARDTDRHFAFLHRIFEPADAHLRHRADQQPGVGMEGRFEHFVGRALFDHATGVEHDDLRPRKRLPSTGRD